MRAGIWMLALLVQVAVPAPLCAAPRVAEITVQTDTVGGLRKGLEDAVRDYPGVAGVSVQNLRTGESVAIRGDEPFPTASLIKVSVLVGVLEEVRRGRMRLDETLSMLARDRVGGSGVLKHMGPGLQLSVEDAAWLMIVLSDNTATNLILDKLEVVPIWEKMDSLGLPRTRVYRKVFHPAAESPLPDSSAKYGLGVTTPNETVRLFRLLHEGRAVSPALDSVAIRMLVANQDAAKMVRWLPGNVSVAHKSGDVDRARNDCGVLYTPAAPIALCVMTRENQNTSYAVDNPANLLIGRVARTVFQHFNPSVTLPPVPVR